MVELQPDEVRPHGLSLTARRKWEIGGYLLILLVGFVTALSDGPVLDVLHNVFIWLLVYCVVFYAVDSLMWRASRARLAAQRRRTAPVAATPQHFPRGWHPSQGPPPRGPALKTWQPYKLDTDPPCLN